MGKKRSRTSILNFSQPKGLALIALSSFHLVNHILSNPFELVNGQYPSCCHTHILVHVRYNFPISLSGHSLRQQLERSSKLGMIHLVGQRINWSLGNFWFHIGTSNYSQWTSLWRSILKIYRIRVRRKTFKMFNSITRFRVMKEVMFSKRFVASYS